MTFSIKESLVIKHTWNNLHFLTLKVLISAGQKKIERLDIRFKVLVRKCWFERKSVECWSNSDQICRQSVKVLTLKCGVPQSPKNYIFWFWAPKCKTQSVGSEPTFLSMWRSEFVTRAKVSCWDLIPGPVTKPRQQLKANVRWGIRWQSSHWLWS